MAVDREAELLEAAQAEDEGAFEQLVEPFRSELHAHCYRMLGSVHDADDALQDVLLRAWRSLGRFERRSSLRTWLYRIATNACLDVIAKRPKRVLPLDQVAAADPDAAFGAPLVESVWVEPYPDEQIGVEDGYAAPDSRYEMRESVELAFVAAHQHLPATQRAALILREVLGFSARETAETLETTTASVNSALQRARATVEERLPEQSQQATLRSLGDRKLREIVEGYMEAMQRGDVSRVVNMLSDDAAWSMPPLPNWFLGTDSITGFLHRGPLSGDWRWSHLASHASGQPAVGSYAWHEGERAYLAFALDVLTLDGDRIGEITSFINRSTESSDPEYYHRWPEQPLDPERASGLFERFGLPLRI
jgi:RNA polymerase sigma-70 factor, ECF subfamily